MASCLHRDTAKPSQRSPETITRLLAESITPDCNRPASVPVSPFHLSMLLSAHKSHRGKVFALPSLKGYFWKACQALSATREMLQEVSVLPLDGISHLDMSPAWSCRWNTGASCRAQSSGSCSPRGLGSFSALLHNWLHKFMDQLKLSAQGKDYFHKLRC